MRISDWSSDVCFSDLWWQEEQKRQAGLLGETLVQAFQSAESGNETRAIAGFSELKLSGNKAYRAAAMLGEAEMAAKQGDAKKAADAFGKVAADMNVPEAYRNLALVRRSEEHTSELQSLMRISYAVFCLKNNMKKQ